MQSVPLSVDDEVKSLGDALSMLVSDIKAKKGTAAIIGDALPLLMSAVAGYAAIGADIKKLDNQVYLLKCLAGALEPAV